MTPTAVESTEMCKRENVVMENAELVEKVELFRNGDLHLGEFEWFKIS